MSRWKASSDAFNWVTQCSSWCIQKNTSATRRFVLFFKQHRFCLWMLPRPGWGLQRRCLRLCSIVVLLNKNLVIPFMRWIKTVQRSFWSQPADRYSFVVVVLSFFFFFLIFPAKTGWFYNFFLFCFLYTVRVFVLWIILRNKNLGLLHLPLRQLRGLKQPQKCQEKFQLHSETSAV